MKKRIRNILIALAILIIMVGFVIPGAFWIWDAFFVHVDDADLRLERPVIPDEENAYTYLVQATNFTYEPYSWDELYEMTTNGQWDAKAFEAFVETNKSQFVLVDRALECERMQIPEIRNPEEILQSHLGSFRNAARCMAFRNEWRFRTGNHMNALTGAAEIARMGFMQASGNGPLIEYLVGRAIAGIGLEQIADMTALASASSPDFLGLAAGLPTGEELDEALTQVFKAEYEWLLMYARWFQDGRVPIRDNLPSAYRLFPFVSPFFLRNTTHSLFIGSYRTAIRNVGRIYADMDLAEMIEQQDRIRRSSSFLKPNMLGDVLYVNFSSSLGQVLEVAITEKVGLQCIRTLLALKAYKQDKGSLPDSLQQLIPDYLDAFPIDAFDGELLRYDKDKKIVYSVGKDLKDEGGLKEYEDPEYPDRWYSKDIVFDIEF